jgi:surface antigen
MRLTKRSKKRLVRYGLLTANLAILLAVVFFVAKSPSNTSAGLSRNALISVGTAEADKSNPLDQLSSADIAVHVATLASLDEAVAVRNNADTVNSLLSITPADDKVVAKPQVVATELKSHRDIKTYTVQEGDTISSIASEFGITSDSIRWSNGLSGDNVAAGKKLTIPPVTGIVYVVKQGDTADSLAQRYRVSKSAIVAFNDAEVSGLKVGQRIVIPDGSPPITRTFSGSFSWGGFSPVYGGNGYDRGYCTWWSAIRRQQIGRPVPSNFGNAITWEYRARMAGMLVNNTPRAGAVIWTPASWGYGHVGFVERVNPDGSVWVSDMNSSGHVAMDTNSARTGGWGRVSYRLLSPDRAATFRYIH